MTIAITGATGFVGGVVVPLLLGEGHCVRALVRGAGLVLGPGPVSEVGATVRLAAAMAAGLGTGAGMAGGGESVRTGSLEVVGGDLLQPERLAELVRGADVVIHLAAAITVSDSFNAEAFRVNSEGTQLLLEAARAAGVRRFVQVSSVVVFEQAPRDQVLNEERALAADSGYDYERSKWAAHTLALDYNTPDFEVVVLAPTAVIGPYDRRPSRIGEMVINLYRGRIPAIFPGGIDFVDVRDVAAALAAACRLGQPGKVYLLSGGWHSLAELRDAVAAVAAARGGRVWAPQAPLWLVRSAVPVIKAFSAVTGRLRYFNRAAVDKLVYSNRHVDSARARAELGFVSRPFGDTIRDTVEWFRGEGYIK